MTFHYRAMCATFYAILRSTLCELSPHVNARTTLSVRNIMHFHYRARNIMHFYAQHNALSGQCAHPIMCAILYGYTNMCIIFAPPILGFMLDFIHSYYRAMGTILYKLPFHANGRCTMHFHYRATGAILCTT
jgi:hypothetical protein